MMAVTYDGDSVGRPRILGPYGASLDDFALVVVRRMRKSEPGRFAAVTPYRRI